MDGQITQVPTDATSSNDLGECWFCGFLSGVETAPKSLLGRAVRSISSGGWGFTILQLDTGTLVCVGRLSDSQDLTEQGSEFDGSAVACGWNHTIWTTQESNKVLEMKLHTAASSEGPLPCAQEAVLHGESVMVRALAAGEQHSLALDANGAVWAWGNNMDGQLGIDGVADSPLHAQRATSAQGTEQDIFEQAACGARHSCALTRAGQLFTWGCNLHDQCGVSSDVGTVLPRPMPVTSLDGLRITHVAAGLSHTVVCTDAGAVYTWGWNRDGQLGHGPNQPGCRTPRLVESQTLADAHVVKVCSGSRHCAVLTEDGEVYTWGWNAFGQLGTGCKDSSSDPVLVKDLPTEVQNIECGWWHTLFLIQPFTPERMQT